MSANWQLTNQHLKVWSDGSLWLTLHRQKTKVPVNVKLLPIALEILDKYKDSIASRGGKLLPVLSNQKCNEYIKEMAAVCGINDDFTFHSARHTFATTVTLENGVPIESVSKMLGHTNVKTTQPYARITDTKVSNDMDVLQENLQGVFDKPLTQSVKSRKKVAQAKEIAQLAQQLGVAL